MLKQSLLAAMIIPSIGLFASNVCAAEYESPTVLEAGAFFPKTPLKGKHYTIENKVPTDGFMSRTLIHSDFGDFTASGPGMLKIRLHEIDALEKLKDFESTEEFQKGAKESTDEKFSSLKQLYDHPDEAAAGIKEGVNRFFKRVYRSGKTGAQKVGDIAQNQSPGSAEEPGPGAKIPGWSISEDQQEKVSKYELAARATGNVAVNLLGFDESRRKLAKRLAVDPYTTNSILDAKLDEVTWSIFAGDLGVDIVTSLIPGGILIKGSSMVEGLVWDTPPGDLLVSIEQTLKKLGFEQESIDRLLRHRYYPLSYQVFMVNALDKLAGIMGLTEIMPLILSVETVDQARFLVNTFRMLANYHQSSPLDSLDMEGSIVAHDKNHGYIVMAPVDYISWSAGLDQFSHREIFNDQPVAIYVAREISPKAREQLQSRGWNIHENSTHYVPISGTD